jgi:S-adenosylmethionine:tRNA ribosyltransferase-isomerase
MSTRLADYDYLLPDHLIAKYPPARRGDSRLLVVHRDSQTWKDRQFTDIIEYLNAGDVLVLNQTKVIPARLIGKRLSTGARIEVMLHQRIPGDGELWKVLMAPARKAPVGEIIQFDELTCKVESDLGEGEKIVRFDKIGGEFWDAIERIGQVPLPPYFHRAPEESDKDRYQTVFAKVEGAVAAPTAGLHFTDELLDAIQRKGIRIAKLTLHTGLGTFRPVESEDITHHKMHEEYFELDEENAAIINLAKQAGKRCIAVGTTSVRAVETIAGRLEALPHAPQPPLLSRGGGVHAASGMSSIFIYPPYKFKVVDAIVTNFHLPRSTLLMMISAFADEGSSEGREFLLRCYNYAIKEEYRFFSYGDAMLLL